MDSLKQVQILVEAVYISLHANALAKGMNPSVLPPVMGKYKERLDSFAVVQHPLYGKK